LIKATLALQTAASWLCVLQIKVCNLGVFLPQYDVVLRGAQSVQLAGGAGGEGGVGGARPSRRCRGSTAEQEVQGEQE